MHQYSRCEKATHHDFAEIHFSCYLKSQLKSKYIMRHKNDHIKNMKIVHHRAIISIVFFSLRFINGHETTLLSVIGTGRDEQVDSN